MDYFAGARNDAVKRNLAPHAGRGEERRRRESTSSNRPHPGLRFAVGVLWHPEAGDDARLFEELVREAELYSAARND